MSEEYQEVKLVIKADSYKAVQQYLHNTLKLTKPDVEAIIAKNVESCLDSLIRNQSTTFSHMVERNIYDIVKRGIADLSKDSSWNLDARIREYINKEINHIINQAIADKCNPLIEYFTSFINITQPPPKPELSKNTTITE